MKKNNSESQVFVELVLTVIVAFALSTVIAIVLAFIATKLDAFTEEVSIWINTISSIIAGLVVGYQMNTILAPHSKNKRKK